MSSARSGAADGSAPASGDRGRGGAAGSRSGTGQLAVERGEDALEHRVEVADAVDGAKAPDRAEMLGHGRGLLGVDAKALADGFGRVVLAAFGGRAAGDAFDDQLARHVEPDRDVEWLADAREQRFE